MSAYQNTQLSGANFLSGKNYIVNSMDTPSEYRLDDTITRKEFMKIVSKLSGLGVNDLCEYKFTDVANDWGCKYIEFGLNQGFVVKNILFRPDENVSQLEAIKLVFKSRGIEKQYPGLSWQEDYIYTAFDKKLIVSQYLDYNTAATRGWIFELAARSFGDFSEDFYSDNTGGNIGNTIKTYVDGKLDGVYKEFYSNGVLRLETEYNAGNIIGSYKGFYETGDKNFEAYYKNGKLHGIFRKYYQNGGLSQEESYVKGMLTGVSYFYNKDGQTVSEREYIGGNLLYEKIYDE